MNRGRVEEIRYDKALALELGYESLMRDEFDNDLHQRLMRH